jgi:hypothetical protein
MFSTPQYVARYLIHYWGGAKVGTEAWNPSMVMAAAENLPSHAKVPRQKQEDTFDFWVGANDTKGITPRALVPYKAYHEVSGGLFGWKGLLQSMVNSPSVFTFPALVLDAVVGTALISIGAPALSIAWFISATAILAAVLYAAKRISVRWQTILPGVTMYGKPIASYEGRPMPQQGTRLWQNRALWLTIFALKFFWNWAVFRYLLDATMQISVRDRIIAPNFRDVIASPVSLILVALVLFIVQRPLANKLEGSSKSFAPATAVLTVSALFGAWWGIGGITGGLLAIIILWLPFAAFYFLDTYSFFYIIQGIQGAGKAVYQGQMVFKNFAGVRRALDNGALLREFVGKIIPRNLAMQLTQEQKEVAFSQYWNLIIESMYVGDFLNEEERQAYAFGTVVATNGDVLAGEITKRPDLSKAPRNKTARRRLISLYQQLKMDAPQAVPFEEISFSVMTPVYNEFVLLLLDEEAPMQPSLNRRYAKGGHTLLTYLVERYRDEWNNLIERMKRRKDFLGRDWADTSPDERSGDDIARLEKLARGGTLELKTQWVREEVEMWASRRFQPLGRTVAGVMQYRKAFELLAQFNFHDKRKDYGSDAEWMRMIHAEVDKRFQYVIGYQEYSAIRGKSENDARIKALRRLMTYYPTLELAYIENDRSCLVVSGTAKPDQTLLGPGPIIVGYGKPENQNHMLTFVRGRHAQLIDMNQDLYVEDALMMPNLLQEFRENPELALVGFPEEIFTEDYGLIASLHGHTDRTFVTVVQRQLNMLGVRFHYGHPDVYDMEFVRGMGGISKTYVVNEDILGGYNAVLKGKHIECVEYIKALKARETSWMTTAGIFEKFAGGGIQQFQTKYMRELAEAPTFGNWFDRQLKMLSHFYGGPGFYWREPWVKRANLFFVTWLVFAGISGFAALPLEISLAFLGIVFAGSIIYTGLIRMIFDFGWWTGFWKWVKVVLVGSPFFQAHVLTYASGANKAHAGHADYVATGRGPGLEHFPVFPKYRSSEEPLYNFVDSHLRPSLVGMVVSALGIWIWWNPSLALSFLYLVFFVSSYFAPILLNPGATPVDVSYRRWGSLFTEDVRCWLQIVRRGAHLGSAGSVIKPLSRLEAFVHGVVIFSGIIISVVVTSPISLITNLTWRLRRNQSYS